ncbi:MAG: family 10 glycosylhydrolase [Anaerolineae bacterium]|jgi:uncharacterized lipoprotein YddW (UPF0748 family)|nr:family 10 glycosylhydrolase [Anaerolineae bacterium]
MFKLGRWLLCWCVLVIVALAGCAGQSVEALPTEVSPVQEAADVEPGSAEKIQPEALLPEKVGIERDVDSAGGAEFRAIWVQIEAAKTPEQAEAMLDRVVRGHFNTIFYCVGSGAAPYRSELVTPLPSVTAEYDPLAYVVEQAHARGVSVHAWWSPGLIMEYGSLRDVHPDWDIASLPDIPDDLHWANFSLPEVRRFVGDVVMEIVENYAVDGVHLDYIRYPDICSADGRPCQSFFDQEDISLTVQDVYLRLRAYRPTIQLSAAVKANGEDAAAHLQHWPDWLAEGSIDYVMPMAYLSPSRNERLVQYLTAWESLEGASRIVPGLSVFADSASLQLKTPEQLRKQLDLCAEHGFRSTAIFDERLIDDRLLEALAYFFSSP